MQVPSTGSKRFSRVCGELENIAKINSKAFGVISEHYKEEQSPEASEMVAQSVALAVKQLVP